MRRRAAKGHEGAHVVDSMAKSELRSAKEGPSSRLLPRWLALAAIVVGLAGFAGCSTTTLVLGAVGIATDTSVSWEIVKHLHGKLTEGDPVACARLDGIERALNPRCGAFVADSLKGADVGSTRLGECPLTTAARDSRLWPVLPALLAEGARPAACAEAPLVALAQANDCPALGAVPADVQTAFDTLARSDARSVHPDVVRWLSCPNSRAAGLDRILIGWLDRGALNRGTVPFSPLSALHPGYLVSPFAIALEAHGHSADDAFGGAVGQRAPGFEEALRRSDWAALDWWLSRRPQLATRVPAQQAGQLSWLPLARVIVPGFLAQADSRAEMVAFLMARGADPQQRMPSDPSLTVVGLARTLKSPLLALLETPPATAAAPALLARVDADTRALRLAGQ